MQQLGKKRERNPLKWGSSVAGYLNAGEEYLAGATRRLKEEIGVSAPLAKFGSIVMPDMGARKFITLYVTLVSDGRVTIDPEHIEDYRFESVAKIRRQTKEQPSNFTETFLFLFRFYCSALELTGTEEWQGLGGPDAGWKA